MPDPGRAPHHVTGADLLDRAALLLGAADTVGDDEPLPGRVGMPGRACSALEGDERAGVLGGVLGGEQRLDADVPGEVLCRARRGWLRTAAGDHRRRAEGCRDGLTQPLSAGLMVT